MTDSAPIYDDKAHVRGTLDLTNADWINDDVKGEGGYPEIAFVTHSDGVTYTAMRNSDHPEGPVLVFTPAEWEAFVLGVKDGEFDEPW
ncbi:DUF397 domain-containing protein [Saccharothrix sp.]|uniref:DUF397 domain-containing protein n=1 Tax=Saccharothrix sp. TaxID=1873460 RepID=UPI002811132E|nr:DUF397 domain-containing protein [Saccharothrix sp.]